MWLTGEPVLIEKGSEKKMIDPIKIIISPRVSINLKVVKAINTSKTNEQRMEEYPFCDVLL